MSSKSSEPCGKIMRVRAFQRIVPRRLGVPSTLKVPIGCGNFFRGKLASKSSPRSMKFPVAPESTRAVVSTVWVPTSSLMGKLLRPCKLLAGTPETPELVGVGWDLALACVLCPCC